MSNQNFVPNYAFLIKGTGMHENRLQAFDLALRDAGPLVHNLVTVSSILPANCKIISREEGIKMLEPGQITFCVMARQDSNKVGEKVTAAIGVSRLRDDHYGFISEHHATDQTADQAARDAEMLAREMFALKLGLSENELSQLQNQSISQGAHVGSKGDWVSVIALCVFVL